MEEAGFQSEVSPRHNLKALYKKWIKQKGPEERLPSKWEALRFKPQHCQKQASKWKTINWK
jgi:hypothetical protein